MVSVWCPNGCKVFSKYTDAYWALSKHQHGTKQDQECGITCIAYLSNIVKTMLYNVLQILCVSERRPWARRSGPRTSIPIPLGAFDASMWEAPEYMANPFWGCGISDVAVATDCVHITSRSDDTPLAQIPVRPNPSIGHRHTLCR